MAAASGATEGARRIDAVYGISEEPMSAEEWKKQFVKAG
jgi:hypothetical protein